MKKIITTAILAAFFFTGGQAQQISVVSPSGATQLFTSLDTAILTAVSGSTLYLSGGGFQINGATKINKRLTLIGVGHRPDINNPDGNTVISGNLFLEGGSDNSALLGFHLTGDVNIGTTTAAVNTILVRFCNINSVQIKISTCQNIHINQNYIRNLSNGGSSTVHFTNNILRRIYYVNAGVIDHNVIREGNYDHLRDINNSQIKNNIFVDNCHQLNGSGNIISNNMIIYGTSLGDNFIKVNNWDTVFVGSYSGVNVYDNYELKPTAPGKNAATDGTDIGVYGGTGFSNTALPPGPRITRKQIADKTDENGNLRIQVEVMVE